jgi:tripartite-type tricarboxylate transporter receptor subunit TctC
MSFRGQVNISDKAMSTMPRAFLVLCAISALLPCSLSRADDYPSRPIHVIVPYSPGGPTDVYGRLLAQYLGEALKQPLIIENRPGAGTIVGTDAAARSAPDGYTLLMMSSTHTVNESLVPKKPYKLMRDFVAVAPIINSDLVMVVPPSLPADSVKEFIELARAKPGSLNFASSGIGSNYHMAGELFKAMTGTNLVHVPYKGSGTARTDILAGQVQMMFDSVPTMAPFVLAEKVRALATTGIERSQILPNVPTMSEAGVPGYEATLWVGLMAPAGTPKPVIDLLNSEINKFLARPDVHDVLAKQGAVAMSMTPGEFDSFLRAQIAKWEKIVNSAALKFD